MIDTNTQKQFFSDGTNPIGQVVLLGSVPARIIGIVEPQTSSMGSDDTLNVYMPYTTVMSRMLGQAHVRNIVVRINDKYSTSAAENAIVNLLTQRHGAQDIFTMNSDSIRQTIEKNNQHHDPSGLSNCRHFSGSWWYWCNEHYVGFGN